MRGGRPCGVCVLVCRGGGGGGREKMKRGCLEITEVTMSWLDTVQWNLII